jgi:hypothetical protein
MLTWWSIPNHPIRQKKGECSMTTPYEVGVLYELARELIGGRMSLIAADLGRARALDPVNVDRISELKAESMALFLEREDLRSDDLAAVKAVIAKYTRTPNSGQASEF